MKGRFSDYSYDLRPQTIRPKTLGHDWGKPGPAFPIRSTVQESDPHFQSTTPLIVDAIRDHEPG